MAKITFNPFGFIGKHHGDKYKGIHVDSRGKSDDAKMLNNFKSWKNSQFLR